MQIAITDILTAEELCAIAGEAARLRFDPGRASAGRAARLVKDNGQAREGPTLAALRDRVSGALLRHPVFDLAVRPRALSRLVFSRYRPGQGYGSHIDNPLMEGMRTDVSFTLFLSRPESYEGGELVIESHAGEDAVKLPAGSLLLYPATSLHRVAPVTRGERLACVGWAQSWIRDAARREVLFDLETAKAAVFEEEGKTPAYDLLAKASANLVRMWSE